MTLEDLLGLRTDQKIGESLSLTRMSATANDPQPLENRLMKRSRHGNLLQGRGSRQ